MSEAFFDASLNENVADVERLLISFMQKTISIRDTFVQKSCETLSHKARLINLPKTTDRNHLKIKNELSELKSRNQGRITLATRNQR